MGRKKQAAPSRKSSQERSRRSTQGESSRQPNASSGSPSKRHKRRTKTVRVGTKVYEVNVATLRSIKLMQLSTTNLIQRLPFSRVVREIMQDVAPRRDLKIQVEALNALQEASEMYITTLFEDSNLAASHAKRLTVRPVDMRLVLRLRTHNQ